MRLAAIFLSVLVCRSLAASPEIAAHLPQQDIAAIIAAVQVVTREPILEIAPAYSPKKVADAIPRKTYSLPIRNGKVHPEPTVTYERTDEVAVSTGDRKNLTGGSFGFNVSSSP